jgi:hypothetical protein
MLSLIIASKVRARFVKHLEIKTFQIGFVAPNHKPNMREHSTVHRT